jgi:hypothetical protein
MPWTKRSEKSKNVKGYDYIKSFWATNLWGNDHCCCFKMIYNWSFVRKRANANSVWCFRSCLNNMYTWVKPSKIMYLNTSSRHLLNGLKWMNQICKWTLFNHVCKTSNTTSLSFPSTLKVYFYMCIMGPIQGWGFKKRKKNFKIVIGLTFANNI